jgi:hypothetical protein
VKGITTPLAAAALALAVSGPAVLAAGGSGTRIVLKAAKAFPAAKGAAKFRAREGERELQVEVEHIRRLAQAVVFYVGGQRRGTAKVNGLGEARFARNTELGQAVPAVTAGTKVRVRTAAGLLIVFGSF